MLTVGRIVGPVDMLHREIARGTEGRDSGAQSGPTRKQGGVMKDHDPVDGGMEPARREFLKKSARRSPVSACCPRVPC